MSTGSGGDVEVAVGANVTPYMQKMAEVKLAAKETAESFGIEFDRGAHRAETRFQRGIDGMLKGLANAKDPIQATSALIEGLGRSFMIASSAFLGIGIGTAIYEEINKAREESEKLNKSLDSVLSVNPDLESVNQLQKDIGQFEKIAETYANRGLLEKILFGSEEDEKFKSASALNDVKKSLVEIDSIRQDMVKNEARILEASSKPLDRERGKSMIKQEADEQEAKGLQQKLDEQIDARKEKQDQLDQIDKQIKQASVRASFHDETFSSPNSDNAGKIEALNKQRSDIINSIGAADSAIQQRQDDIEDQKRAAEAERKKVADDALSEKVKAFEKGNEEDAKAQAASNIRAERHSASAEELSHVSDTDAQHLAYLQSQLSTQTGLERLAISAEERNKAGAEADKLRLSLAEAQRKEVERRAALQKEIGEKTIEQQNLESQNRAVNGEASLFHGQVSSLQRIGGGGNIGLNQNHEQLRAAQEGNAKLERIHEELATLNAKLEGR